MKIITAAMLIDNGVTSMNGPAPCPDSAVMRSQTFKNITDMRPDEGASLANSFLRSCNTAFIKLIDEEPLTDSSLTQEAQERFGLGRDDWKTGIPPSTAASPPPTDRTARRTPSGREGADEPAEHGLRDGDRHHRHLPSAVSGLPDLDGRQLARAKGLPGTPRPS
ncbi:hypothetical protein SHKM778_86510 [Streptomyces sp. KM77-8]|uniref:Penicillin-binding protein transpeptidase domain-containing protein n=1 Tax=Streptomyces haneummycinicus TaxID=3074435 RepID=A0AAT9HX38_9ACTN